MIVLTLAAIAGGIYAATHTAGSDEIAVNIESVRKRDTFQSFVTASGEIVASRYADIGSSIMGRLVELRVKESDRVRAGQILAVIDPVQAEGDVRAQEAQIRALEAEERVASEQVQSARSDLLATEAREREARTNLDRVRKLVDAGILPPAQLDAAKAAAEATEAQRQTAESDIARSEKSVEAAQRRIALAEAQSVRVNDVLSKTQITAPIDGIVSRLQVRQGEMVVIGVQNQPGTTLMTISDLSSIDAEVQVAEADVVQIRTGHTARVTMEALPDRVFEGEVVEVGASALPSVGPGAAAREFKVVIRLNQPDALLRPGLTCDVEILVSERSGALTVPLQAVVLRNNPETGKETAGVFQVRDGRAQFTPVKTGIIGGLEIEVAGPIENAQIVSGPVQVLRDLKDGAAVRPQ
jgi:HlyD family secretion protein